MRAISPLFLVLLSGFLLVSGTAQTQANNFNPNCGLLGSLAQYREHYMGCKANHIAQSRKLQKTSVQNCAPKASKEDIAGSATQGLSAGTKAVSGVQ
jgi:hypothetical protein